MAKIGKKLDQAEADYTKNCETIDKGMDLDIKNEKARHAAKLVVIEKDGETSKNDLLDNMVSDIFKSLSKGE